MQSNIFIIRSMRVTAAQLHSAELRGVLGAPLDERLARILALAL